MFRCIILFLLCLPTSLLLSSQDEETGTQFTHGYAPAWVNYCDFSLEPIPAKSTEVNVQCLLVDLQTNWEEQTRYHHFAVKSLTQSGVSEIAEIEIDFDPSYEKVIVHDIRVFREGKFSDRIQTSRHNLLQRESELEADLYHGELTLVYFLEDICEGDIVEYSYSIVGTMPFFTTHFASDFPLQGSMDIERFYRRLLIHPQRPLFSKSFNTMIEPRITDLSPTLREWAWEIEESAPYLSEEGQPDWYETQAHIQLSGYQTWSEVIEKFYPIYTLQSDPNESSSTEMKVLIKTWEDLTSDPAERAFLALRFVQEKVRYLGFEEGMNGFKPTDPRVVFQRRFGDCKDKTFLLCALLRLMNIDSVPVLVNAGAGQTLIDSLPSPFAFDHVILRIDIGGSSYWVDPTILYQGGSSLEDNFFPEYHWGLPLSKDSTGLVRLHECVMDRPTEIETTFIMTSEDSAELRILWSFYGYKADSLRNYIANVGLKKMTEGSLKEIQKMHGKATLISPVLYSDDREKNILTLTESYHIPMLARSGKKMLKIYSIVIRNYLDSELNPERLTPYSLFYPIWIKEHIHVENPYMDWKSESDSNVFEHESLYFTNSLEIGGQSADFYFELKHLKDHVPTNTLYDYWEITNEIERHSLNILPAIKSKAA